MWLSADRNIQFGRICIAGTGVPIDNVCDRFNAVGQ